MLRTRTLVRTRSVFAPFFGIQTATLTATERLVQLTGCLVVPMFPLYDSETREYTVTAVPGTGRLSDAAISWPI